MSSPNPPSDGSDSAGSGNFGPSTPENGAHENASPESGGPTGAIPSSSMSRPAGSEMPAEKPGENEIPVGQPEMAPAAARVTPAAAPAPPSSQSPHPGFGQATDYIPMAPEAPSSSATFWVLFGIGMFSLFLLLMCSGMIAIIYYAGRNFSEQELASVLGTGSEKAIDMPEGGRDFFSAESYREAIEHPVAGLSDFHYGSLYEFIDKVMSQEQDDYAALRSFVSTPGYVRQMVRAFPDQKVTIGDRRSIVAAFDQICYGPELYLHHKVLAVEAVSADEYAVTMLVWDTPDAGKVVRWWIQGGPPASAPWKLCDWKAADEPLSDAGEYAVIYHETNELYRQNYYSLTDRIYGTDYNQQLEAMEEYKRTPISPLLKPGLAYQIAKYYLSDYEPEKAEELLIDLQRPQFKAAKLAIMIEIAEEKREWSDVVKHGQEYLKTVGANPWVSRTIADALAKQKDWEAAQEIWLALANIEPLKASVVVDVNEHLDACSDQYLKQFATKQGPDSVVLNSVVSGYGLDVLSTIKRWRDLELPLQKCSQDFLDAKQNVAKWEYDQAVSQLKALTEDEDAKTTLVQVHSYYEIEEQSVADLAEQQLRSLDYWMMTEVQRYAKSEDKLQFFTDWYFYDYLVDGMSDPLPELVEALENDFPDSWALKVSKARLLHEQQQWQELDRYLMQVGVPDSPDDSDWRIEIESLQLESALNNNESFEQLLRFSDRERFYYYTITHFIDKSNWEQLAQLLENYRLLPSAKRLELDLDTQIFRSFALIAVSKNEQHDALLYFKKALDKAAPYEVYMIRTDIRDWLVQIPETAPHYWQQLLQVDSDGYLLRYLVSEYVRQKDVAGLSSIQLRGDATKNAKHVEFAIAYLKNDLPVLFESLTSPTERAELYSFLGYSIELEMAAKLLQRSLESGDEQQKDVAIEALNAHRSGLGEIIFAIEEKDWETVDSLDQQQLGYVISSSGSLNWWRQRDGFQAYVERYGRDGSLEGEWAKLIYNRTWSDQEMTDRLQTIGSDWILRSDLAERLNAQGSASDVRVWTSEKNPNYVFLLANVPDDLDLDKSVKWQANAKSVLFLLSKSVPDSEVETQMLEMLCLISQDSTALMRSQRILINEASAQANKLKPEDWLPKSKNHYSYLFDAVFTDKAPEKPEWQTKRETYRAFANAGLKVGDKVQVRLELLGLKEVVDATITGPEQIDLDDQLVAQQIQVRLDSESSLLPFGAGDKIQIQWDQLYFD